MIGRVIKKSKHANLAEKRMIGRVIKKSKHANLAEKRMIGRVNKKISQCYTDIGRGIK